MRHHLLDFLELNDEDWISFIVKSYFPLIVAPMGSARHTTFKMVGLNPLSDLPGNGDHIAWSQDIEFDANDCLHHLTEKDMIKNYLLL